DTIDFDSGVFSTPRTITLNGTQLELSDTTGATSIAGPAAGVTVSGGGKSRVFQVDALVTASIADMTITGGFATDYSFHGGGLLNAGTLTLNNCTISDNSSGPSDGGGVFNSGSLTMTSCTVSRNRSENAGGGLLNSGSLMMSNCTVSGNSAG